MGTGAGGHQRFGWVKEEDVHVGRFKEVIITQRILNKQARKRWEDERKGRGDEGDRERWPEGEAAYLRENGQFGLH